MVYKPLASTNEDEGSIEGVGTNEDSISNTVVFIRLGLTSEESKAEVLKGSNPEISVEDSSSIHELLSAG